MNKKKPTWRVCQGRYGIRIGRSDKSYPGGKHGKTLRPARKLSPLPT